MRCRNHPTKVLATQRLSSVELKDEGMWMIRPKTLVRLFVLETGEKAMQMLGVFVRSFPNDNNRSALVVG